MYDELIKSLRVCASLGLPDSCLECPRFENGCDTLREDAADAIEVLSKKEKTTQPDERLTPKKPKVSVDTWVCPECGRAVEFQKMLGENIIFHGYHNFCPNCGQAIDWTEPPKEEE